MQAFAKFLWWRWDFEFPDSWLLFWFWLKTHHRWWVRVLLKKESQLICRILHTFVSEQCWDPIETTLCTFGTCLYSLTQSAEPVSSVVFKLADSSHNVLCPAPVVLSWYWYLWQQCLAPCIKHHQPPFCFLLSNAATTWKL